jgi:hypothetical protein
MQRTRGKGPKRNSSLKKKLQQARSLARSRSQRDERPPFLLLESNWPHSEKANERGHEIEREREKEKEVGDGERRERIEFGLWKKKKKKRGCERDVTQNNKQQKYQSEEAKKKSLRQKGRRDEQKRRKTKVAGWG